ncbi:MAG: EFR1 family ferrodoxin [bacterium]
MKTILFYFTGTGNSLKLARDVARELGSTELWPIARFVQRGGPIPVSADRIGIVCPVYAWGLPLIVPRFIHELVVERCAYIFGLVTCGGFPAATLKQMDHLLKEKGLKLSAGFSVQLPGNYTPLYGAIPENRQTKLFSKAEARLKKIAETIREGRTARIESNSFLVNLLFSGLIYRKGIPRFPGGDSEFWLNEKCNGCGICARVCPVNNIVMKGGRPQWQHHCERCLACLQWCPEEAVECGKNTPGRKRYRHPAITVEDIVQQK